MTQSKLTSTLLSTLSKEPNKSFNYKQISRRIGVSKKKKRLEVLGLLEQLAEEGKLVNHGKGKFQYAAKLGSMIGTVDLTSSGFAYVSCEGLDQDVFVSQKRLRTALNGDTVKVQLLPKSTKSKRIEGEVVEIIERTRNRFVGILELKKQYGFLITNKKQINSDIFVPRSKTANAQDGQKVVVEVTDWGGKHKSPIGKVIEVLGNSGENDTEIHAILEDYELPYAFSDDILQKAQAIPEAITEEEIAKREDFRDTLCFTIDPHDAKDFDDAISYKELSSSKIEVGVHIADVSHYIRPRTKLDKEAYHRGTSVYLVDRVVPMLPENLSNGICSLRPNEDKLCFSVIFQLNKQGKIKNSRIVKTIIKSQHRFSYEQAQEVIDTQSGKLSEELCTLNQITQTIRQKRLAEGSLNFERSEMKFHINEQGKATGVYLKTSKEANQLIEELMLLANKAVAEFVMKDKKKAKTFVYRIHEKPSPDKLSGFANLLKKFGHKLNTKNPAKVNKAINGVLADVKGRTEQNLVETVAVKTMSKAAYSTQNIGHYGLHFKDYSHFTSPIRRYPDIMVHRLLEKYLAGGKSADAVTTEQKCKHLSQREEVAVKAERDSIKYKQAEYLSDKINQQFEGTISGVTQWGIYVEINENKCEGMISVRSLMDDFYVFDEENFCLRGERTQKKYQLGDPIGIRIVKVDMDKKRIDFKLV